MGVLCNLCWCRAFLSNSHASSVVKFGRSVWSIGSVHNVSPSNFASTITWCFALRGNLRPVIRCEMLAISRWIYSYQECTQRSRKVHSLVVRWIQTGFLVRIDWPTTDHHRLSDDNGHRSNHWHYLLSIERSDFWWSVSTDEIPGQQITFSTLAD